MQTTRTLHPCFGVKVDTLKLQWPFSSSTVHQLLDLVHQHGVVLLPKQHPTDSALVDLARQLGPPLPGYRPEFTHPDYPELVRLGNVDDLGFPTYLNTQGEEWHSDATGTAMAPGLTILNAVEAPVGTGDTLFTNTAVALREMTPELRARIHNMEVTHNFDHHNDQVAGYAGTNVVPRDEALRARNPDVIDGLLQRHPATDVEHLFLSPQFVRSVGGLAPAEQQHLLDQLLAHVTQSRFVLRHRWQPADLIMFDNRLMMHSATAYDYAGQRRYLRQIIINGVA